MRTLYSIGMASVCWQQPIAIEALCHVARFHMGHDILTATAK